MVNYAAMHNGDLDDEYSVLSIKRTGSLNYFEVLLPP